MGTSRKRGGDKAHAKKVAARNQKIKTEILRLKDLRV